MDNHKYRLDNGWLVMLKDLDIAPQDILRAASLPLDLFSRKSPMVTATEMSRLWRALEVVQQDNLTFPLDFALSARPETFSPPIFASFCSANLNVAAKRIGYYKPIVGPIRLHTDITSEHTTITINTILHDQSCLPASFIAAELSWWVHMPRMATREHLIPLNVYTKRTFPEKQVYEDFFGVEMTISDFDGVRFAAADAERPFLTANDAMWAIFEPELNKRMKDLDQRASYTEKVRACLMEILASGQYKVGDVASRLAISPRTLQRYLRNEGTNFQEVLDGLRKELAHHYLASSKYTNGQIAFLLGYKDPNSFFRAFRSWTGQTPEIARMRFQ